MQSITIPTWIQYQDEELTLGFNTAQDAEEFLKQQAAGNGDLRAFNRQWEFKRIYRDNDTVQWILSTEKLVTLHFPPIEDLIEKAEKLGH